MKILTNLLLNLIFKSIIPKNVVFLYKPVHDEEGNVYLTISVLLLHVSRAIEPERMCLSLSS